jgi:hypothetical protein
MVSEFLLKLLAETAKETFSVTKALTGWAPKSNTYTYPYVVHFFRSTGVPDTNTLPTSLQEWI